MGNGAHALIETLVNAGVDTCFTNPGTSEMHFVAALDDADMRGVLCLFEGVASGAADGYARMADKPAATLLHLDRSGEAEWEVTEVTGIDPDFSLQVWSLNYPMAQGDQLDRLLADLRLAGFS